MEGDKLYNALSSAGFYTKSLDEFNNQFATPEQQEKLYGKLSSSNYYTKSLDEFKTQFFDIAEPVKEKPIKEEPKEKKKWKGLFQNKQDMTQNEKPTRTEWLIGQGVGKSIMGTAVDFINQFNPSTNPTLVADLQNGGGLSGVFKGWQEKREKESQWLKKYDPTMMDEVGAFAISMITDAPVFGAAGTGGRAMATGVNRVGKELITKFGTEVGRRYLSSSLSKIATQASTRMASSASALGIYDMANNFIGQVDAGVPLDEIEYKEVLKSGGHGAMLGAGLGILGTAGSVLEGAVLPKLVGKGDFAKYAWLTGIKLGVFGAENAMFLYGHQAMTPAADREPLKGKDWLQSILQLGTLKIMGAKGEMQVFKNSMDRIKAGERAKEVKFTREEMDALGVKSENDVVKIVTDHGESTAKVADIMKQKDVPFTAKEKLAFSINPKAPFQVDMSKASVVHKRERSDGTAVVWTTDKEGNIYEVKYLPDMKAATKAEMNIIHEISENQLKESFRKLTEVERAEIDTELKKKGFEEGIVDDQITDAFNKPVTERNKDQVKITEDLKKMTEDAYKKREALEKEQKSTETGKKKTETKEKLTETKEETSKDKEVKKTEEVESSQKKKPTSESESPKVTPKKEKDGSEKAKVPDQEVQKQQGKEPVEKTKPQENKVSESVGKDQGKEQKKEGEVARPEQKKDGAVAKKVEVKKGVLTKTKDFAADVRDAITKKTIDRESKRELAEQQVKMDKELKESVPKQDKRVDKNGLEVTVKHARGKEARQYLVKRNKDGTYSVSSSSERDVRGRRKKVTDPRARASAIRAYKTAKKKAMAEFQEGIFNKHLEEADARINDMAREHTKLRNQPLPTRSKEFQKEEGVFPEKPSIMEGGKKQRPKTPMEESGEMVPARTIRKAIADQVSVWARQARKQKRYTEKQFTELSSEIWTRLKIAVNDNHITKGQYRSIIGRVGRVKTPTSRAKLIEYVDKVINGSEWKGQFNKAKSNISKIKKLNKKDKSRFGDAYEEALKFTQIDPAKLTIDELYTFNKIADKIAKSTKAPNATYIDAVNEMFAEKTKDEVQTFEQRIEKAKEDGTIEKVKKQLIKSTDEYIENTQDFMDKVSSASGYMTAQLKLNAARKRVQRLASEELITEAEAQVYYEKIGKGKEIKGEWEAELEAFRKDYTDMISEMKSYPSTKDAITGLPKIEQPVFRELFSADRKWMDQLSMRDLLSMENIVENLRAGYVVPEAYALKNRAEVWRNQNSHTNKAVGIITNTNNKFWNRIKKQGFTNLNSVAGQQFWKTFSKNARKKFRSKMNMIRLLASTDKFRIDTMLGNFSKRFSLYSQYLGMQLGLQKETATKLEFDKKREAIFKKFTLSKKMYKNPFKGAELLQRDLKRIGNFMIEKRHQSQSFFKKGEITELNASRVKEGLEPIPGERSKIDVTLFDLETNLFTEQFKEAQDNKLTKRVTTKDGKTVEVFDIDKYEKWLRKDKDIAKLLDEIENYLEEAKSYTKAATMENGRTFIEEDFYVPYIRKEKGGEITAESVLKEIEQGNFNPKMQAGATYSLKGSKEWLENDISKILHDHTNDILRNYFVKPQVENAMNAIKGSFIAREAELSGKDLISAQILRDAILTDMKDAVQRYYNSGKYSYELNRWHDRWLRGAKKGMLLHPARIPSELASNVFRATVATSTLPLREITLSGIEKRAYNALHEQYIGPKYWTSFSPEISGYSVRKKWKKGVIDIADEFIMFSDRAVGIPLFRNQFSRQFEKITGKKFEAKEFIENPDYYIKNREAIEQASVWGVRRLEELFNAKTSLSSAQLVKFGLNTVKADSKHFTVRLLNTLQSFSRNEVEQLRTSARRIASGDAYMVAMGVRDINAVVFSNAIYGILRRGLGTGTAVGSTALMSLLGMDPPPLTEYEQEEAKELLKIEKLKEDFIRNEVNLVMGGSANAYAWASRIGMYVMKDADFITDDQKEQIYSFMEENMYSRRIPEYGRPETILKATMPIPSPAIGDLFQGEEAFMDFMNALNKAFEGGSITDKEYWQMLNTFNLMLKYSLPNPVSPSVQRMIRRKVRELDEEELTEGMSVMQKKWYKEQKANTRGKNQLSETQEARERLKKK